MTVEEFSDKIMQLDASPGGSQDLGPKYAQVKACLRRVISDDELSPGTLLPSEQTLAERFRVSNITVKRALNDLAAEGLIARKKGVGTYVADTAAQEETSQHAEVAASSSSTLFLSCGQSPRMYHDLLGGVERMLAERDNTVLFVRVADRSDVEFERLRRLVKRNSVSLVLLSGWVDNAYVRFVKALGVPVIVIGNYPLTETVSQVCADVHDATRQSVELLLDAGAKRVLLANGSHRYGVADEMARAFDEAVAANQARVKYSAVVWDEKSNVGSLHQQLLDALDKVDAIVVEGGVAQQVMLAVATSGKRIPEDLKIVSYDPPPFVYEGTKALDRFIVAWDTELPRAVQTLWEMLVAQPSARAIRLCLPLEYVRGDSLGVAVR